jgi:hypothetical protein
MYLPANGLGFSGGRKTFDEMSVFKVHKVTITNGEYGPSVASRG